MSLSVPHCCCSWYYSGSILWPDTYIWTGFIFVPKQFATFKKRFRHYLVTQYTQAYGASSICSITEFAENFGNFFDLASICASLSWVFDTFSVMLPKFSLKLVNFSSFFDARNRKRLVLSPLSLVSTFDPSVSKILGSLDRLFVLPFSWIILLDLAFLLSFCLMGYFCWRNLRSSAKKWWSSEDLVKDTGWVVPYIFSLINDLYGNIAWASMHEDDCCRNFQVCQSKRVVIIKRQMWFSTGAR